MREHVPSGKLAFGGASGDGRFYPLSFGCALRRSVRSARPVRACAFWQIGFRRGVQSCQAAVFYHSGVGARAGKKCTRPAGFVRICDF